MTDFDVLKQLSELDDKTIRCSTTLVGVDTIKQGCVVKIGIDKESGQDLMKGVVLGDQTHICVLYVVDKKKFFDLKNK